ncbi:MULTISPECIES: hypothetical protein [unclassified Streptomyces]|uniref:hypothetical protein n=1 Tax=unclassified Streptomyces TaxID=2593676 RepID=UPI001F040DAB|nr:MULTISPECIES: hypothetical protein [unclassified Streptomyces]MCH0563205.1 hypothetical protein [Streptomyces sp. MUM 2J]MCH0568634.1 hypothetical protein [Streptomyces sp. MUM 136J]
MSPRPRKAAVAVAAAAALCLTAAPARAAADPGPLAWTQLTRTYTATGAYAHEPYAALGGYVRSDVCVTGGTQGALGYAYLNEAHIGSLDPATPAGLVYASGGVGTRELAAVEWVVEDTGQAAPELFGRTFASDVLPGYFTLAAWIYRSNADGLFAPWNPAVSCPVAQPSAAGAGGTTAADTAGADAGDSLTGTVGLEQELDTLFDSLL